jgi:ankyrin repeat protein
MMPSRPCNKKVRGLIEILEEAYYETQNSFNAEQWLLKHEGDNDLLKIAANQKGIDDCTVLWYAVCISHKVAFIQRILQLAPDTIKSKCRKYKLPLPLHAAIRFHAPYDVIKLLLDTYPEAVTVKNFRFELPLHLAVRSNLPPALHALLNYHAPYDVIKLLLDTYPEAATVKNFSVELPLHLAVCSNSDYGIIRILLDAYPEGAKMQDNEGRLPLHHACQVKNNDMVAKLLEIYPEGAEIQDKKGCLPLHHACEMHNSEMNINTLDSLVRAYPRGTYTSDNGGRTPKFWFTGRSNVVHDAFLAGVSKDCIKWLLYSFPGGGRMKRDINGMIPLHLACSKRTPSYHEYITALLERRQDEQLSIQDNQGRTPFQLLPVNDLFLLHRLVANSKGLSERAVRLFVDMFPNSITTPNKYGMLPFHCACLNRRSKIEILMLFISMSPEVIVPIQPS